MNLKINRQRVLRGRIMKFPRDQGQQQQQPQLQNAMSPTAEESLRPAPPPPTSNSNLPPNSQNSNAATNNLGKYDENLLFQLQRAPPSSTLGSTLSRAVSNVHVREDSLIDLNEDKSYMRQSQPEPPPESVSSRPGNVLISRSFCNYIFKNGIIF